MAVLTAQPVRLQASVWLSRRVALVVTLLLFGLRVVLAAVAGLGDDEAYYWTWSRSLDLSYFEHPGMVAWPIHLSTALLGNGILAVRLPTLFFSAGTLVVVFLLVRRLFPEDEALAHGSVLALGLVPLFAVGFVFVAPDAPFVFFWVLALYFARLAIGGPEAPPRPRFFYLVGLAGAFGLLSKYNMVLLPPAVVLHLWLTGQLGTWLRRKEPYLSLLLMLAFAAPIVIWNGEHGWASLLFHLRDRHHAAFRPLLHMLQFAGAQLGLVSPVLLVVMLLSLRRALAGRDDRLVFLAAPALLVVGFFAALCPFGDFKPHWPAAGWITAVPLALFWLQETSRRRLLNASLGTAAAMSALVVSLALLPIGPAAARVVGLVRPDLAPAVAAGDISSDLFGWDQVATHVRALQSASQLREPFAFAHTYQTASQLAFAAPDLDVVRLGERHDEFEVRQDPSALRGRDAVFVTRNTLYQDPSGRYPFASCERAVDLPLLRGGVVARTFSFWICRDYQP